MVTRRLPLLTAARDRRRHRAASQQERAQARCARRPGSGRGARAPARRGARRAAAAGGPERGDPRGAGHHQPRRRSAPAPVHRQADARGGAGADPRRARRAQRTCRARDRALQTHQRLARAVDRSRRDGPGGAGALAPGYRSSAVGPPCQRRPGGARARRRRRRGGQRAVSRAARIVRYNAVMKPLVGIIMGSSSDWETMQSAAELLDKLAVPYEVRVVSAHRTPDLLFEYAAGSRARGLEVLIAGAGGAAHLPGMAAAKTSLPVLGVPVQSKSLGGLDSLLSIVQMPAGVPVATFAIGAAGATNAALCAAAILANKHPAIATALDAYRERQTAGVLGNPDPRATPRT